jgi:hypothetical protein
MPAFGLFRNLLVKVDYPASGHDAGLFREAVKTRGARSWLVKKNPPVHAGGFFLLCGFTCASLRAPQYDLGDGLGACFVRAFWEIEQSHDAELLRALSAPP